MSSDLYVADGITYQVFSNGTATITFVTAGMKEVSVPSSVTFGNKTYQVATIKNDAFQDCKQSLTTVEIPATMNYLVFPQVFDGCYRLKEINIDPKNTKIKSQFGVVHRIGRYGDEIVYVPCGFYGPGNGLYMSDEGVKSIGRRAFKGSSLVKLVLSPDLSEVQSGAILDCPNLEEIHFWNGDCKIGADNFTNCPKLKALYFRKNGTEQKMTLSEWKSSQSSSSSTSATAQTPEQLFRTGYDYYVGRNGKSKDYRKAVEYYRKAAEQGHAGAQCNLGLMLRNGEGVAVDYKESAMWFRKSAEQGNANGQVNLGYMYDTGKGVTKDYNEAFKWYSKAAEQGDKTAQYNLYICYKEGKGTQQNSYKAAYWRQKSGK